MRVVIGACLLAVALLGGCREETAAVPESSPGDELPSANRKMTGTIVAEQSLQVGSPIVLEGPSPSTQFAAVFEDDGNTGVFYGVDTNKTDVLIVDALHVYNVDAVVNPGKPSIVQILWSTDGEKTALVINGYPHAVFDFAAQRGYCRTGFPPSDPNWTEFSHEWDDAALELFAE